MAKNEVAPVYEIPLRRIIAVEHPMIVQDVDNGLKTFGAAPLHSMLDFENCDSSLPLYLRHRDPTCTPIVSNNVRTNSVLVKLTIPQRTGRKRKRGSRDPFEIEEHANDTTNIDFVKLSAERCGDLKAQTRLEDASQLLRSMKDNVDDIFVDVVGSIDQTHRYRGLADFHYSTTHTRFMTEFRDKLLPLDIAKLKSFKFDLSRGPRLNEELIPPPIMTEHLLPFNWGYHQNPTTKLTTDGLTGAITFVNQSAPARRQSQYINATDPTPVAPLVAPPDEPLLRALIADINRAQEERPIWTRRALTNHLRLSSSLYLLGEAYQYVGYQFRRGPWRDAIVKFGTDPRSDPKYRIYQTLFFKLFEVQDRAPGDPWKDARMQHLNRPRSDNKGTPSHLFDGTSFMTDGKVWQVCDITEPMLQQILATALVRDTCDPVSDGWYHDGTWAKAKAVMRSKLSELRLGVRLPDEAYSVAVNWPDILDGRSVHIPLPSLPGVKKRTKKRRNIGGFSGGRNRQMGKGQALRGGGAKRGRGRPRGSGAAQRADKRVLVSPDPRAQEAVAGLGGLDNGSPAFDESESGVESDKGADNDDSSNNSSVEMDSADEDQDLIEEVGGDQGIDDDGALDEDM